MREAISDEIQFEDPFAHSFRRQTFQVLILFSVLFNNKFKYFFFNRCPEIECGLGFSTKQCLQVHLRKAHGFSEDNMPQVQRSIPYTFDAYSGGVIKDPGRGKLPDFSPESGSPTRLHQIGDGQVLFDSIDVIPHFI